MDTKNPWAQSRPEDVLPESLRTGVLADAATPKVQWAVEGRRAGEDRWVRLTFLPNLTTFDTPEEAAQAFTDVTKYKDSSAEYTVGRVVRVESTVVEILAPGAGFEQFEKFDGYLRSGALRIEADAAAHRASRASRA